MTSVTEAEILIKLRIWQLKINEMIKANRFNVPIHLGIGHEALALALNKTMGMEDQVCVTHRNCVYNLVESMSLETELDYYLNNSNLVKKMGSMNLAIPKTRIKYASSILGNNFSVGAGLALGKKIKKEMGRIYVLTGDGAIEEGAFWESLIFMKSNSLKMTIIIEDNNFSLGSSKEERRCSISIKEVCRAMNIKYIEAFGNNYMRLLKELDADSNSDKCIVIDAKVKTFNHHAGATPGWTGDTRQLNIENEIICGTEVEDPISFLKIEIGDEEFYEIIESCQEILK